LHNRAKLLLTRLRNAQEVWITEAIITEVGNALSAINRNGAFQFIQQCYQTENIRVVTVDTDLLLLALELYQSRSDKTWGLTDCISFVVMKREKLTQAVTADRHFVQAGFRALMLEDQN